MLPSANTCSSRPADRTGSYQHLASEPDWLAGPPMKDESSPRPDLRPVRRGTWKKRLAKKITMTGSVGSLPAWLASVIQSANLDGGDYGQP